MDFNKSLANISSDFNYQPNERVNLLSSLMDAIGNGQNLVVNNGRVEQLSGANTFNQLAQQNRERDYYKQQAAANAKKAEALKQWDELGKAGVARSLADIAPQMGYGLMMSAELDKEKQAKQAQDWELELAKMLQKQQEKAEDQAWDREKFERVQGATAQQNAFMNDWRANRLEQASEAKEKDQEKIAYSKTLGQEKAKKELKLIEKQEEAEELLREYNDVYNAVSKANKNIFGIAGDFNSFKGQVNAFTKELLPFELLSDNSKILEERGNIISAITNIGARLVSWAKKNGATGINTEAEFKRFVGLIEKGANKAEIQGGLRRLRDVAEKEVSNLKKKNLTNYNNNDSDFLTDEENMELEQFLK